MTAPVSFIVHVSRIPAARAAGRKIRRAAIIIPLFFILLCPAVSAEGGQNRLTLLYPPDRTVMEYELLGIVLSVPEGAADSLKVTVNSNTKTINTAPERLYQCFTVRLMPGINRIDIIAEKGHAPSDSVSFTVFHRSDLAGEYQIPPAGYEKDFFHMKEHGECSGCHILKPTAADRKPINLQTSREIAAGDKFDRTATTCYSCHKGITAFPYVHGPVALWSCLSCHDPSAEPLYAVEKPAADVCYRCHADDRKKWMAEKNIHGPVSTGKCTICHNPHASDYPHNLYMPVWNLCINCHPEKASGGHILSGDYSSGGHPTHNRMDPLRPGKELTCTSCHDPHASNSPNLWAFDVENIFHLCLKCHTE